MNVINVVNGQAKVSKHKKVEHLFQYSPLNLVN